MGKYDTIGVQNLPNVTENPAEKVEGQNKRRKKIILPK